ncbi:MAG: GAF domain-containing protein [Cyanobacteria bacterium]|nr:GAF domain-containing protein [Cyanobacteriota bacterium]MDW8201135.1 GAF domain-containing protein [Cyanobacteriota bacterium SKYGB_h_bin112]
MISQLVYLLRSLFGVRLDQGMLFSLMSTTPADLVFITTGNGQLQFVSPNVERLLGYSVEQVYRQRHISALLGQSIKNLPTMGAVSRSLRHTVLDSSGNPHQLLITIQRSQGWRQSLLYICRELTDTPQIGYSPQQVDRERLIATIIRRIRQSLDLDWILSSTVREVQEFLQTDRVVIYQFHPDWSGTVVAESVSPAWVSALGENIDDPCFRNTYLVPYQQGRIRAIDDIYASDLSPCHIRTLERFQVRANLVVPILHNEQLWGLIIAHHCVAPRHWQPWEAELMRQLADQVAIAIKQSELYRQLQELNASLEMQVQARTAELQQALRIESLLKRITDKVRDSLDEAQILTTAVEELADGLDINSCDAALYDHDRRTSTILYEAIHGIPSAINTTIAMADYPEIYQQLLQGQDLQQCWVNNTPERPLGAKNSTLACPIVDDQGVIGDLWLYRLNGEAFSEQEVRLVRQVANQGAIALRQARLYKAVQAQVDELKRLNQLKEDFVSTVSHELRTPLSSINLAIQMLEIIFQKISGQLSEAQQIEQYLKILRDECQREISLISDLLDLQQLEAGTEALTPTTIQLQAWIPHLLESFEQRIQAQNQTLQVHIEPDLPSITVDLSSLERVLTELVTNACKYSPAEAEIRVSCRIMSEEEKNLTINALSPSVAPSSSLRLFQIAVTNTGTEISVEEQSRIFEKFYRIPNADPWKYGGTGLGLALVKKLMTRLGGSIHVESQAGWVKFTILLPDRPNYSPVTP